MTEGIVEDPNLGFKSRLMGRFEFEEDKPFVFTTLPSGRIGYRKLRKKDLLRYLFRGNFW